MALLFWGPSVLIAGVIGVKALISRAKPQEAYESPGCRTEKAGAWEQAGVLWTSPSKAK